MTFLAPIWLILGGLAIAVLVLHMRRRRQFDVPSVLLWRLIDNSGSPRRSLRWPPPTLLMILQVLIVLLVALALAQPIFGANRGDSEHTIYLLDSSASMRATDVSPSRFDDARTALINRINGVDPQSGNRFSVITVGPDPRIEIARQSGSDGIVPILESLAATDGPANWPAAADLIRSLIGSDETPNIVVLTDGADAGETAINDAFPDLSVERVAFGEADTANLGLTATLSPVDAAAGQWRLFGAVTFTGVTPPAEATVRVLFQPEGTDSFVDWDEIDVSRPGAVNDDANTPIEPVEQRFVKDLELPGPGTIMLALPRDAGPEDNQFRFTVRQDPVGARILYLGEHTQPLIAALQSFDNIDLVEADALPANDSQFDLIIVDNVTVPRKPDTNVLWLGTGRVEGQPVPNGIQTPSITGWNSDHALAGNINWDGLELQIGYASPRMQGATVLLESGGSPLIQARTTPEGREVRVSFDIASSNWSEQTSFPIFISDLVNWLGIDLGSVAPPPCQVGAVCPIEARLVSGTVTDDAGNVVWSANTEGVSYLLPGIEQTFVPTLAGIYTLRAGDEVRQIVVNPNIAGKISLTPVEESSSTQALSTSPQLWIWLLALALLLLVAETILAGRGSEQFLKRSGLHHTNPLSTRRRLILGVRLASIVFLVAAIAGLPWLAREPSDDVVVVVGTGLGPQDQNATRNALLNQVAALGDNGGARGGIITAGDTTQIATDLGADQPTTTGDQAAPGTNLEEAMLLAAAMVPADRPGHVVLATDGNETEGDIANAVATLAARGLTVDIQPVNEMPPGEVLVEQVTAPPRVFAGDNFHVQAVLFSQGGGPAHVTITRAGEVIFDQDVNLLPGRNLVQTTPIPAGEEGNLLVEVTLTAAGDTYAENNTNGLMIPVEASPKIAIVTPQPPLGEYFAQALSVQGLDAEILQPDEAPTTLEGWLQYDSVVLMNVPAIDFDVENQQNLEQMVRVYGRGLLILGGENSFGPGGYYQTALEDLSPLSARIEQQAPQVAIVFVLDRSSSMGGMIGDQTRLDIAKEATVTAISLLDPSARVGIVVFDSEGYVLVPLTQERDDEAIRQQLLPVLAARGGTNMYPGLAAAINELIDVDAATKHIVILTDGATNAADFDSIMRAAAQANITISAVGIGAGEDRRLTDIANFTGGTYHSTNDFRALPAILSQETLMLANSPYEEQIAPVQWVDRSADFLANLPDELPPVYAFMRTTLKPGADLHMTVTDSDGKTVPLMASWRYGNGRVLAFATHGAGAGTADWIQMPEYPLMWSQIIRHFLPDAETTGLNVALERVGDVVRVTTDAVAPDGTPLTGQTIQATIDQSDDRPITLVETAPGRYQGEFPVSTGAHQINVTAGDLTGTASIYVAYPARYDFGRADFDKLQALAAATGGQVLLGNDQIPTGERVWVAQPGWRIWTLVALILFMLDLTIRHAPALFGLRRRFVRKGGPAVAVPAE